MRRILSVLLENESGALSRVVGLFSQRVKVRAVGSSRDEIKRLADIFRGQIVDVTPKSYTVQLSGTKDKIDAFINALKEEATLLEIVRSGLISLSRGEKNIL